MPPGWKRPPRRSFEGFINGTPDPPKSLSRNKERASLRDRQLVGGARPRTVEAEARRAEVAMERSARRLQASRAGAPTKVQRVVYKGKDGVWLSTKAFRRLREGRERAELTVRSSRLRRMQSLRRPSLDVRVTTSALLQSAGGVSASKVPYVLAVTAQYHLGNIPLNHLLATSTALEHVRTAGFCLKQQLLEQIGKLQAAFCIGTDTSTRGGTLGSYIVSFVQPCGAPTYRFFGFDRPASTIAPCLADSIWTIVKSLTETGGEFVGFSSDAPKAMVGEHGGVGVLLMEKAGFVRHDTCEFHASARLLAVIDSLWPPQMNIPSVSQFVYLLWYILNDDWALYRGRIVKFLKENNSGSAKTLLSHFGGATEDDRRHAALTKLKKPEKPNVLRWGTLTDIILFTPLYFEALQAALDEERVNGGTNAAAGSIAAMCSQWVKWSGSNKLCALLATAVEFVKDVWQPADREIAVPDADFKVPGCFKTFSRPRRVLKLLMLIESRLDNVRSLGS